MIFNINIKLFSFCVNYAFFFRFPANQIRYFPMHDDEFELSSKTSNAQQPVVRHAARHQMLYVNAVCQC